MTDTTNNYNQLLELAVLDSHGLLEPIEAELFTKSFHNAPASIQDEIIKLQRELAEDDSLLPLVTPAPALKQKVLQAVTDAADQEARRLAPLALIGARASVAQGGGNNTSPSYFWRIAALVLFGISVVLGIIAVDTQRRIDNITQMAMNLDTAITITDVVGSKFKAFVDNPYCHVTRLERENGNPDGYLRIATNELFGGGYVIGIDLEQGEEIIIQGTTASGDVIELARITADSAISGRAFEIDKALVPGLTLTAINATTGQRWV